VDFTRATPDAFRRISGWRVAERVETLSEHLYILMEANETPRPGAVSAGDSRVPPRAGRARQSPRWKMKGRNEDLQRAVAIATAWS
jgi:hypothetical protein